MNKARNNPFPEKDLLNIPINFIMRAVDKKRPLAECQGSELIDCHNGEKVT